MKAFIASDLHFEFHADHGISFVESLPPDADVLICAGDVSSSSGIFDALVLLLKKYKHVVYTYGNHEFYGSSIKAVKDNVKSVMPHLSHTEWPIPNLHILDGSICEIEGQRFIGGTLWFRDNPNNIFHESRMNDFWSIKNARKSIYEENERVEAFLRENMQEGVLL